MISAETLSKMITLKPSQLARSSGFAADKFKSADFLGLTNGQQFCYSVTFFDELTGEDRRGKVFVESDPDLI